MEIKPDDYIYPAKVVWVDVLDDLKKAGVSAVQVGIILDIPWSTVRAWRKGQDLKHSEGEALLELHRRYCSPPATKKRQREAKVDM